MVRVIEQPGQNTVLALHPGPGVLPEAPLLVSREIPDAGHDLRPVSALAEGLEWRFVALPAIPFAAGQDLVCPPVVIAAGEGQEMLLFKISFEYIRHGNGRAGEGAAAKLRIFGEVFPQTEQHPVPVV